MEKVPGTMAGDPDPGPSPQRWSGFGPPLNERRGHQQCLQTFWRSDWGLTQGQTCTYLFLQHPGFSLKTPTQKFTQSSTNLRVRNQERQASSHRMRNEICLLDFLSLIYTPVFTQSSYCGCQRKFCLWIIWCCSEVLCKPNCDFSLK